MGDSETSGEETVEADTTTLSVIEVPKNIDMTLSADFKKILFQKMELDNVTGKLIVADGAVRMTPLSLNAFGGAMVANGIYSTAESVVRPMVNFDLDIQKASFEKTFEQLDMIQKIVPIFAKTGGTYSVKVDLKSALDSQMSPDLSSLSADGVIQSNDIQLQNIEVFSQLATLLKNDKLKNIEAKDLKISFTIKDGKVKTSPFDMKLGNITMNLSGVTGLDQTIDYRAKINIPGAGALSNVSATIGGTFSKPSIKLNTDEVVKNAVTNVIASEVLGVDAEDIEAQKAAIRKQAEEAGNKLIATAKSESEKLISKASNPLAKVAAQAAGKKLVEEAEKQAQKLKNEAEKLIEKQYGGSE